MSLSQEDDLFRRNVLQFDGLDHLLLLLIYPELLCLQRTNRTFPYPVTAMRYKTHIGFEVEALSMKAIAASGWKVHELGCVGILQSANHHADLKLFFRNPNVEELIDIIS